MSTSCQQYFPAHPIWHRWKFDKNKLQGLSDQEYEILSILFSAVDQILDGKESKQTIETLAKMADHDQLPDEYKILVVVLSKMVVERYKKFKNEELEALEKKVKELENK